MLYKDYVGVLVPYSLLAVGFLLLQENIGRTLVSDNQIGTTLLYSHYRFLLMMEKPMEATVSLKKFPSWL